MTGPLSLADNESCFILPALFFVARHPPMKFDRQRGTESAGSESDSRALWPGLAPFAVGDRHRFPGRGEEIDSLMTRLSRPASGESPLVWLHGDSGCGKTSLVGAGLLPRWSAEFGRRLVWFEVAPENGQRGPELIEAIARRILSEVTHGEETSLDLAGRVRQLTLLMRENSSEEAAEYLAACLRRARGSDAVGLIFIDQFGRCVDELGDSAGGFLRFLRDLSFTRAFPILVALRSFQVPAIRAALAGESLPEFGEWMRLSAPPVGSARLLFAAAPSGRHAEGVMRVSPALIGTLIGEITSWPSALPLAGELLAAVSREFPDVDEIDDELVSWHGGLGRVFRDAAAGALASMDPIPPGADLAVGLDRLMIATGVQAEVPRKAGLLRVAPPDDPVARALIAALVGARVLGITGDSAETATVFWTWPPGLEHWERAREWRENRRRLDARLEFFQQARARWESEGRTPVCLLHAAAWLDDARALLERHQLGETLASPLIDFLEQSLALDARLRSERETLRKRLWALFGGTGALVIMVLILIATSR